MRSQDLRAATAPRTGILQRRAELVRELMHTHPEELRSVLLAPSQAAVLLTTPDASRYLEHEVALAGDVLAASADDFEHGTAQDIVHMHDRDTGDVVALSPTPQVSFRNLLHRPLAVTGIQLGSEVAVETVTPANPQGAYAEVKWKPQSVRRNEAASASSAVLSCTSTGVQRTAVLLLQFPANTPGYPGSFGTADWWQQALTGADHSVNALWTESSGGGASVAADVYGPLALQQSYGCPDYLALRSAALAQAADTIDLSRYNRIVLAFPASTCGFGGLADIGCNGADSIIPHPYSVVWMPIMPTYTAATGVWGSLAHELGHSLGLNHANTLDFGALSLGPLDFETTNPGTVTGMGPTVASGSVTGVDTEYGDRFSAMGNPWGNSPGPYSAEHRARLLGWIPLGSGMGTATHDGTYQLQASEGTSGMRSLRVLRDADSASWLWLEYRDGSRTYDGANLASVSGENVTRGAVLHYENGYGDHGKSYQLDMTPSARGNNFADGALAVGRSWSDPYSPLTLAVNSVTSAGLSVSVRYDKTCAVSQVSDEPIAAAGGSGTLAVTAPADCAWSAGTNASWLTLGGNGGATGSGSVTWTAAPNPGESQRVTYLTVGRVSRRLVQLGTGASVSALQPANRTVDPGAATTLTLKLHSAAGVGDVRAVQLNALGAGVPTCSVLVSLSASEPVFYLLNEALGAYTSGVAGGGAGSLSTPGCSLAARNSVVSATGSTISVAINLTFPAAAPGVRGLFATVNASPELPVGTLTVGAVPAPQPSSPLVLSGPPDVFAGAPIRLHVSAGATAGQTATDSTVTLAERGVPLAQVPLTNGEATITLAAMSTGLHTITASYAASGTTSSAASASAQIAVVDFAVKGPGTAADITVNAGETSGNTATVTLTAGAAGFPFPVVFTCDGAPANASCTVTPGVVTPGAAVTPVLVSVATRAAAPSREASLAWLGIPLLSLLAHRRTRRTGVHLLALGIAVALLSAGLVGCGSGLRRGALAAEDPGHGGTPAGTSVLTVRAVAASDGATLTHTASVTLRVK